VQVIVIKYHTVITFFFEIEVEN